MNFEKFLGFRFLLGAIEQALRRIDLDTSLQKHGVISAELWANVMLIIWSTFKIVLIFWWSVCCKGVFNCLFIFLRVGFVQISARIESDGEYSALVVRIVISRRVFPICLSNHSWHFDHIFDAIVLSLVIGDAAVNGSKSLFSFDPMLFLVIDFFLDLLDGKG